MCDTLGMSDTEYPGYDGVAECPGCDGIVGVKLADMMWDHITPNSDNCRLKEHYPMEHRYFMGVLNTHNEHAQKAPNPQENLSNEQFGNVIHVDFKNKKRLN